MAEDWDKKRAERNAIKLLDALEEARGLGWRIHQECGDADCRVCPPRLALKARIEEAMTELASVLGR